MCYKIEDFTLKFTSDGLEVDHKEHECYCSKVESVNIKKKIHQFVDDTDTDLWSDGHHEEAATRLYLVFINNIPMLIGDIATLIRIVNTHEFLYELTIEDNLL